MTPMKIRAMHKIRILIRFSLSSLLILTKNVNPKININPPAVLEKVHINASKLFFSLKSIVKPSISKAWVASIEPENNIANPMTRAILSLLSL